MGAQSVDSTGMEAGVTSEVSKGGDADSTGWIGMVSDVACAKTTEFCDEICDKVGMMFASIDVCYIVWQGENQTMPDEVKGRTASSASIRETLTLSLKNGGYVIWQSEHQIKPEKLVRTHRFISIHW